LVIDLEETEDRNDFAGEGQQQFNQMTNNIIHDIPNRKPKIFLIPVSNEGLYYTITDLLYCNDLNYVGFT
jgi:hypothetical protein